MTQGNKIRSVNSQSKRELALAGVLLLLSGSLACGFLCSIIYHLSVNSFSGGWQWKKNASANLDTAPGDETDKDSLYTFKKVDLVDLNDSLHLLAATQAMLKLDYGLALTEIEQITDSYRKADSSCRTLEVECRLSLKQSEKVIEIANTAIAANQKDYAGWLWRAQALEQLKKYQEAIADYRKSLESFPASRRTMSTQLPPEFVVKIAQAMGGMVYRRIGACYERLGDYKEAYAQYLKAIKTTSPLLAASLDKPKSNSSTAAASKSIAELNRAIAERPDDSSYYYMRGRAFRTLGKLKEALADFNRVKTNNATADFFIERAAVSFDVGDYKSAARDLRKAHIDDPLYEMAHMRQKRYSLAVMPMTSVKKSKVLNRLDRAIRENPKDIENYLHRGVLQMAFRQYDEAGRDLEQYVAGKSGVKSVSVAKANIYLALCRGLRKRQTEYDILLAKSAETYSDYKWWQAVMLYLEGKGVTEDALLSSAKNNKARLVQAHYYIGQRMAIEGFSEKAIEQFKLGISEGANVDEFYLCKLALIPDPDKEPEDK